MRWSRNPSDFTDVIEIALAKKRTKISLDLMRRFVLKTPVKTGRARGSWVLSYDTPSLFTGPAFGVDKETSKGPATRAAIANSSAALLAKATQPFEIVWISNNMPYIGKLEGGSSKQAKPGEMVAMSLTEIRVKYTL